jgi:uncharacterized protein YpmS
MNKRKKWLKWIGLSLLAVLIVAGVTGWVTYRRADKVPEWYSAAQEIPDDPDVEKRTAIKLQTWANKVSAGDPQTKTANDRQFTVTLTADDINRLISKWSKSAGFEEKMSRYVKNVRVRIADGAITIGGQYVEYDKVVSVILKPKPADGSGYSQLKLDSMRIGEQPLPLVVLNDQQTRLSGNVARQAKSVASKLEIDDHSVASRSTADLYYTSLAAQLFAGQSADAYAFIGRLNGFSTDDPLATRVKAMDIRDGQITLTLETLDAAGREALLKRLHDIADSADAPQP